MKKYLLAISALFFTSTLFANGSGISITRGFSGVDGMNGFAISSTHYWGKMFNLGSSFELTGLFDFSLSYWQTHSSKNSNYSNITVLGAVPTLRLQRRFAFDNGIAPFFDLGYGIGLFNRKQFSNQKLGGYGNFILSIGGGINFGSQSQYDLSYHYLNYNNAGQFKDDDGMFVNAITFTYRFSDS